MSSFQKNIDCAKLVQSYLIPGPDVWAGVFQDGDLIGLFRSKASIPGKLVDTDETYIIPIYYMRVFATDPTPRYNVNKDEMYSKISNILNKHESVNFKTIGWIEVLFLVLMQYPDFIASHPEFRNTFRKKVLDFKSKLSGDLSNKFHYSKIIGNMASLFLEDIHRNKNYKNVSQSPTQLYCLRPRKAINYAIFNYHGTK